MINKRIKIKRVKKYSMISLLLFFLLSLLYFFIIPKIEVKEKNIHINVFEDFNIDDLNYNAENYFTSYKKRTKVKDNINTSKIGNYKITYSLKFTIFNITKKINVYVEDKEKPTIELVGEKEINICPNANYEEAGYKAYDNYDKDITSKVIVEHKENKYIYIVNDTSGNKTEVERIVISKDEKAPELKLIGSEYITLHKGDNYTDLGAEATDNCDGNLTTKIEKSGSVDTDKLGDYQIKYTVIDNSNNKVEITRTIKVIEKRNNVQSNGGVIYLTFDDGPSYVTTKVLDILSRYNVKATFFVTGNIEDNPSLLKREVNEGHAIALHTYTHNYAKVYSSTTAFWDEIDTLNNTLNNLVGFKSTIFRFPGGASNTVSRNYSRGIMTTLTSEAIDKGFHYFDWNVDSDDAGGAINNSDRIYKNVINNLNPSGNNIVLMHDSSSHPATAEALENIVLYGKNNGYTFEKITMDTPMVRHRPNN